MSSLATLVVKETIMLALWAGAMVGTDWLIDSDPWVFTAGTVMGIFLTVFEEEV